MLGSLWVLVYEQTCTASEHDEEDVAVDRSWLIWLGVDSYRFVVCRL
jgi:predicted GNAT family N-acyltransferase